MAWYLYLARCADGSLYAGVTTNPSKRIASHNAGRGSKYVRSRGAAVLAYVEPCASRSAAQRREREVQSWTRQRKLALVSKQR